MPAMTHPRQTCKPPRRAIARRVHLDPLRTERQTLKRIARSVLAFQDEASARHSSERSRTDRSFLFEHPLLTREGEDFFFRKLRYLRQRLQQHQETLEATADPHRQARLHQATDIARRLIEELRDILVRSNLRLASAAARKYVSDSLSFDELFSDATMILLKAIDLFDTERGFRFSTYYVNAAMRHLHKLRLAARSRHFEMVSAEPEYLAQLASSTTTDEIEYREDLAESAAMQQRARTLLSNRHYVVMAMRCGLDGIEGKQSFAAIGDDLGVSKERARQLFNEAIDRLRSECVISAS